MVTLCLCLLTADNCLVGNYANNHEASGHSPQAQESSIVDNHQTQGTQQEHISDGDSQLHTQPMQPFSPLHIPQFSGSLGMGFSPSLPLPGLASAQTVGPNQSKARGASDCPGVCPLCGATLRQARNLRRHLLSSCKYRFSNNPSAISAMQNADATMLEIKQEVEMPGYNDQSSTVYGTDSGSNSCEQIVCKPSLPSPTSHGQDVVSPASSIPSPTIAR